MITPFGTLYAIESIKLTDVIKSNGSGLVNLLKDITPELLESYRQEGNGKILFAVDVNEAADGSEKASTQGITIDSLSLNITMDGISHVYTGFSSETQAALVKTGSASANNFYTLLGDSGSNRITGNGIREQFDSIFTVEVPDDLTGTITSVVLEIHLLDTQTSLGDPEAFYDYSNGFEDLALMNQNDANYLNTIAPGRAGAPGVILTNPVDTTEANWYYYPSSSSYYMVAYEDKFPEKGDYDFNDLVVAFQVIISTNFNSEVVSIAGTAYMLGRGAANNHDWHLKINAPGGSGLVNVEMDNPQDNSNYIIVGNENFINVIDIPIFTSTKTLFPANSIYTNTSQGPEFQKSPRASFSVSFSAPIPFISLESAPFDPYLYVRNGLLDIHLVGKSPIERSNNTNTSFKDENGYPFAMIIPANWQFPLENTDLGVAYPDFLNFVMTGGISNNDWYEFPNIENIKNYTQSSWNW